MHKGRGWRRVLPPALTPNYAQDSHAPVYLKMESQVVRGSGFQLASIVSAAALSHPDLGQIDWKFDYTDGFQQFGAVVTVRLIPGTPDHLLQAFFTDSDANVSAMEWRVPWLRGRWSPFGDNYNFPGDLRTWAPPWGPIFSITLKTVGYRDEP